MRVCVVTTGCLSTAPRVVKEATALLAAGHDVRVVGTLWDETYRAWDMELARRLGLEVSYVRIDRGSAMGRGRRLASALRERLQHAAARAAEARGGSPLELAARAAYRLYPELARLARSVQADLYIGHNLGALPAVAAAASRRGALYAFDAEDDHVGQAPRERSPPLEQVLAERLERALLPKAAYVTAASARIAATLAARYGIAAPATVLNVFPSTEAGAAPDGTDRGREAVSFYWFSQTIGPGRGLETAIEAAGRVRGDFALHLRGNVTAADEARFRALAAKAGVTERLRLHAIVPPWELGPRSAAHDVGLALEGGYNANYANTVTNKLFYYMTTGLAVIASDVPGQADILRATPAAGRLVRSGSVEDLAAAMQAVIDDPDLLARTRAGARDAAATTWNWAREARVLTDLVARVGAAANA